MRKLIGLSLVIFLMHPFSRSSADHTELQRYVVAMHGIPYFITPVTLVLESGATQMWVMAETTGQFLRFLYDVSEPNAYELKARFPDSYARTFGILSVGAVTLTLNSLQLYLQQILDQYLVQTGGAT